MGFHFTQIYYNFIGQCVLSSVQTTTGEGSVTEVSLEGSCSIASLTLMCTSSSELWNIHENTIIYT